MVGAIKAIHMAISARMVTKAIIHMAVKTPHMVVRALHTAVKALHTAVKTLHMVARTLHMVAQGTPLVTQTPLVTTQVTICHLTQINRQVSRLTSKVKVVPTKRPLGTIKLQQLQRLLQLPRPRLQPQATRHLITAHMAA